MSPACTLRVDESNEGQEECDAAESDEIKAENLENIDLILHKSATEEVNVAT